MSVGCPDDVVEGGIKGIGDRIAGAESFCMRVGTGRVLAGRDQVIEGRDTLSLVTGGKAGWYVAEREGPGVGLPGSKSWLYHSQLWG